jgi:hypothetical protein
VPVWSFFGLCRPLLEQVSPFAGKASEMGGCATGGCLLLTNMIFAPP